MLNHPISSILFAYPSLNALHIAEHPTSVIALSSRSIHVNVVLTRNAAAKQEPPEGPS